MASLGENALHVLQRRYLLRDEGGAVVESPDALFRRVARAVVQSEREPERGRAAERFEARMPRSSSCPTPRRS
jgi:ribonucleoside-diphosphate reductase alpha chain